MRPALLLPVLLIGLCSRRGVGTSTNSPTVASASATKSSTTVKSSALAPISTRPTDALRTTSLSTVSVTVHVPPISAKTPEVTSSRASVGTHSETSRATGLTTKPSSLATTVRASIPPMSSPTTKPSSSAAATKGTTPAGGALPGHTTSPSLSSKTTAIKSSVTSAAHEGKVTSPGGPNTTSVMNLSSKEPTTQTTKSHLATEVLATTTTESSGSQGPATAVLPNTTPHVSSAGTKITMRTTSASTTRHAPPLATHSSGTHPAQSELICEKVAPDESQVVILTLNESRTCESVKNSPLEGKLLNSVCQAVTPSFNWSRDQCTVRVAYAAEDTKHLAIIEVSVRTNSAAKQLFDSLTLNKEELEKIGVSNISHSGRTEDIHVEDRFSMPLIITIVCMAASLLLVAAIYGCCHQRLSQKKDQQRLTEELQTMDNGYHDNPTLEVMETSSEMQEKKLNLNGELGDSWIVPMDNLTREDLEEEEDTHL